jgi:hypothetical protein
MAETQISDMDSEEHGAPSRSVEAIKELVRERTAAELMKHGRSGGININELKLLASTLVVPV